MTEHQRDVLWLAGHTVDLSSPCWKERVLLPSVLRERDTTHEDQAALGAMSVTGLMVGGEMIR